MEISQIAQADAVDFTPATRIEVVSAGELVALFEEAPSPEAPRRHYSQPLAVPVYKSGIASSRRMEKIEEEEKKATNAEFVRK